MTSQPTSIFRLSGWPRISAFQTRHGLRADSESGGDRFTCFASAKSLADEAISLVVEFNCFPPLCAARKHGFSCRSFNDEIGQHDLDESLAISSILNDEDESFTPVLFLLLGANCAHTETLSYPVENDALTVGKNDSHASFFGTSHPPFAISKASKVASERSIIPCVHVEQSSCSLVEVDER